MSEHEQHLRQSLDGFLAAFRDLDWKPFISSFAARASVFFPFAGAPRRADGIAEIKAVFAPFFASQHERRPAGPPYFELDPADLQITINDRLALVTFHLHDSVEGQAILCRRTMVWINEGRQWRILHLHASNLPLQKSVEV